MDRQTSKCNKLIKKNKGSTERKVFEVWKELNTEKNKENKTQYLKETHGD